MLADPVHIIGGGVAGLTAAYWLDQAGRHVVVYERKPHPSEEPGYPIALTGGCLKLLDRMGVLEELRRRGHSLRGSIFYGAKGQVLRRLSPMMSRHSAYRTLVTTRHTLATILWSLLASESRRSELRDGVIISRVVMDTKLQQMRLHSVDGETRMARAVIGADGINSTVRRALTRGHQFVDLGVDFVGVDQPNSRAVEPINHVVLARNRLAQWGQYVPGHVSGLFFARTEAHESVSQDASTARTREWLKRHFGLLPPVSEFVKDSGYKTSVFCDRMTQVQTPQWVINQAVLIGDAAHALSPFSGRGVAAALCGAALAARAMAGPEPEQGLADIYEARLRPIISRLQQAARLAARRALPGSWLTLKKRELEFRVLSTKLLFRDVSSPLDDPDNEIWSHAGV